MKTENTNFCYFDKIDVLNYFVIKSELTLLKVIYVMGLRTHGWG